MVNAERSDAAGITPSAASWLLRIGLQQARVEARDGMPLRPQIREALQYLADIADHELLALGSDSRTVGETVAPEESGWVSVAEAAARHDKSESYVQRLARDGRVRCRRIGRRAFLIDPESLKTVLRRTG